MRVCVLALLVAVSPVPSGVSGFFGNLFSSGCERDVSKDFNKNYRSFCADIFNVVASRYKENFVISPLSLWLSFAAIAEGVTGPAQQELLDVLKLPKEECLRMKYYEIATSLESSGSDVKFDRKRYLVTGDGVRVNGSWASEVRSAGLLDTVASAFNAFPEETGMFLKKMISPTVVNKIVDLSGKSIVLDSLNYSALWSTAFPEESIDRRAPFHNDVREQIGTVEMYKVKRRVKLAYLPLLDLRVLELGVGAASRYRLRMATTLSHRPLANRIQKLTSSFISDILSITLDTLIPVELAIPKFNISFDVSDVRETMEELGVKSLWADTNLTQFVTEPAAMPKVYVQSVTLTMDNRGVEQRLDQKSFDPLKSMRDLATGAATMIGKDFIADKPFFYALLDSQTKSYHFMGVYSSPSPP